MATENMNLIVGANFELLKTELNAVFQKGENSVKLLVAPTEIATNNGVTFGEMLDEFKEAFGMGEGDTSISDSLSAIKNDDEEGGGINLENLIIKLNQAFFYYEKTATDSSVEYAISVSIDATQALPSFGFFRIKSLSLAVWNTQRTNILNKMNIGSFETLFLAASNSAAPTAAIA